MTIATCLLIPLYNHGTLLRATVERLVPWALPIFIVDDGSDEETQQIVQAIVADYPTIKALRLPINSGKGAAVLHGIQAAQQAGFTHALQIDADGQHAVEDLPRFLALGQTAPHALICGKPIYDATIPKSRLYGRLITHFWVWIETLGLAQGDSMCGFRLYPIAAVCHINDRINLPLRMAFDIAILVHLVWHGVETHALATHVTYPANGISHFALWRDNVAISATHTRLFFGMLWRFPQLLQRRVHRSLRSLKHAC